MSSGAGVSVDPVAEQAIAWWVRLQSGMEGAAARRSCEDWLAQDPAHRQAWDRLQRISQDARRVPAALAHSALAHSALTQSALTHSGPGHAALAAPRSSGRRTVLRGLLMIGGTAVAGWAGYRHAPWQRLAADLSTSVGERLAVAVADGLHITLNSDSAVRLHLRDDARGIDLLRGEILVRTELRPGMPELRVDTGYGELHAEQARFDLRRTARGARVGVYEGSVVLLREGVATHADAGERLAFGGRGEIHRRASDPDRLAWADGLVVAKDWRLDYFAQYLARQRTGVIRVDPAVAGLRLSGVFPLDDAERALKALEPALPIRVTRHTQYWLQVSAREA